MHKSSNNTSVTRHYARVITFTVVAIVIVVILVYILPSHFRAYAPEKNDESAQMLVFPRSEPVNIRIPKLGMDTSFVAPLGLNEDQTVSVPDSFEKVGWYKNGATPGEIGPSVILGHVDSYKGPAVFYHLGQLTIGDTVEVTREDGTVAIFEVEKLERYDQDKFPTELVYGQIDYPGLRLVTCSGTFNRAEQRYTKNLVVYARLRE